MNSLFFLKQKGFVLSQKLTVKCSQIQHDLCRYLLTSPTSAHAALHVFICLFAGSFTKLPVLSSRDCVTKGFCSCVRLKPALSTIVIYSGLILIIVRPLFILYAHATTGYFRDMLPSLLHTTLFCFLCFEYISKVVCAKKFTESEYYLEDRKVIYVWTFWLEKFGN